MWEFFKGENSFIESCLSLSRMRKCITAAVSANVIVHNSCSELSISINLMHNMKIWASTLASTELLF